MNCNFLSPLFLAHRVMIIFVSQCAIMIMLGCKLLMRKELSVASGTQINRVEI